MPRKIDPVKQQQLLDHLTWWKKAGVTPTMADLEDLERIYQAKVPTDVMTECKKAQ